MVEYILKFKISHWILRLIVIILIVDMFLDEYYSPYYYDWFRQRGLADVMFALTTASLLIIPLFVGLEFWWMRRIESERKALAIDALFAIAYVVFWFGMLFYVFTHKAII